MSDTPQDVRDMANAWATTWGARPALRVAVELDDGEEVFRHAVVSVHDSGALHIVQGATTTTYAHGQWRLVITEPERGGGPMTETTPQDVRADRARGPRRGSR